MRMRPVNKFTLLGTLLLAGALTAPLFAQPYPHKPLRLIIPFPGGGGGADYVGRVIGQKLAERLGQPVVIENRPGAAGNIGIELVAKAQPDGYTLLLTTPSLTISPSLYKKLNYDPVKDLAPISLVAEIPNLFLVRPSLPVTNLKEFVTYARANPGKLNFGGSGIGSSTHLATVLFMSLAKVNLVNVTYKGSAQALIGMLGGEIDVIVIGPTAALPQIQSGRVRALAVLRNERLPSLPNVPTIKEAGVENSEVTTWYGILAPAGTPRDIMNRLNAEWIRIAAQPDTLEKMQNAGVETLSGTPAQFAALIKAEIARWAKVIKDANVRIE
jgi:tripartite-type tricarboxylate transporter receptor subunit TctC